MICGCALTHCRVLCEHFRNWLDDRQWDHAVHNQTISNSSANTNGSSVDSKKSLGQEFLRDRNSHEAKPVVRTPGSLDA